MLGDNPSLGSGGGGSTEHGATENDADVQREIRKAEASNDEETNKSAKQSEDEERLARLYEGFQFAPLWRRLSDALTRLKGDPNAAQILLPLIEVSVRAMRWARTESDCSLACL